MAEVDLESLRQNGFAVGSDVIPSSLLDDLLAAICREFRLDLDDEATWSRLPAVLPMWGHQAQWNIRQHPGLHSVFAAAYGSEHLWVSLDHALFKPPHLPGGGTGDALPIHWDVDPRERHLFQGMIYLTDSPEDAGAFRCVPALFRDPAAWFQRHPGASLDDLDTEHHEVVVVPCRTGDLMLWDSRLPHGSGRNTSSRPRITQAVTMQPPGFWGESAEDRIVLWEIGRANPHYMDQPGFDRVEPWPPAELTPLGRRLLGLEEWPG